MSEKPGDGDLDVDAAWAEIVAHWDAEDLRVVTDDEPAGGDGPSPPGAPDGDGGGQPGTPGQVHLDDWSGAAAAVPPVGRPPAAGEPRPVGRAPRSDEGDDDVPRSGWDSIRPHAGREDVRSTPGEDRRARDDDRDDPALAALDEHFVPDDPPSLRPTDPVSALAWLAALGGPVFLLVAALAWRDAPPILIGAAVLAFVAGFVTLVVRMPDERHDEDDGAVV